MPLQNCIRKVPLHKRKMRNYTPLQFRSCLRIHVRCCARARKKKVNIFSRNVAHANSFSVVRKQSTISGLIFMSRFLFTCSVILGFIEPRPTIFVCSLWLVYDPRVEAVVSSFFFKWNPTLHQLFSSRLKFTPKSESSLFSTLDKNLILLYCFQNFCVHNPEM